MLLDLSESNVYLTLQGVKSLSNIGLKTIKPIHDTLQKRRILSSGRATLNIMWLSILLYPRAITLFAITEGGDHCSPNGKGLLDLNRRFRIKRYLKMVKKERNKMRIG